MSNPDTIRLIVTLIALLGVSLAFFKPSIGVMGYMAIMMLRPGLYFPILGQYRIELIAALLVLFIAFARGKFRSIIVKNDPILLWMFVLLGIMLLSMVFAFDFKTSYDWMWEFLKIVAFFLMIVTLLNSEKDIEYFIWIFGLVTVVISYEALHNYVHGNIIESFGDRIDYAITDKGYGAGHVALANLLLQAAPFLWYLAASRSSSASKFVAGSMFVICIAGVIVAGSRGGFVGLVALFAGLAYFSKRRGMIIACGVGILLIIPLIGSAGYLDYMKTILQFGSDDSGISTSSRITGLRHGIEMLIKRPLLGVGPGCYPLARKAWFGWGLWAHNHYGELAGELGIIGIIVWFRFLYAYTKRSSELRKDDRISRTGKVILTAVIVATGVRLVLGMGTHSVYSFFWYMAAAIVAVYSQVHLKRPTIVQESSQQVTGISRNIVKSSFCNYVALELNTESTIPKDHTDNG